MKARIKRFLLVMVLLGGCLLIVRAPAADLPPRKLVLDMLWNERFDELEKVIAELRAEKIEFYGGYAKLSTVYGYLDGPNRNEDDRVWKDFIEKLEKWAEAYPNSAAARTALGLAYKSYAWKARGSGYADTVTEEGWRLFNERLTKAHESLREAERMPTKDAEVYHALIVVAMAQGWPRKQMEAVFRKGVEFEPNYQQLYEAKAYYLLPRWHGNYGEWEAFAQEAADARGGEEGDILYMAIARSQAWSEGTGVFQNTRISYPRMKKGFEAALRRNPDYLWDANSFCYFACVANDRPAAQKLFRQIGDRWENGVWRDRARFKEWENWALNNGPRPVASTRTTSFRGGVTPKRVKSLLLVGGAIWLGAVLVIGLGAWLLAKSASRSNHRPPPLPRQ